MLNFKNVIVKIPCQAMTEGITSSPELGKPNYELALKQHDEYIQNLKKCNVEVTIMEKEEVFPDSCFVEDAAVIIPGHCAIITNPGALSRNQEIVAMEKAVRKFFNNDGVNLFKITAPGTLDGGDVMMVGDTFYIGESERTNKSGIEQFSSFASKFGKTTILTEMDKGLHLKSGVNYLEISPKTKKPLLLLNSDFLGHKLFDNDDFDRIYIPDDEKYAANCIWMNQKVIVPKNFPKTLKAIQEHGYETIESDTSEFRKLDGGLSCLSLRF